ncbi:MAG: sensor histidine kinase [Betaproteobacteria bacterium]|nr:sensor histidine kinase [Betaproteobacteria bacterium]
MARSINQNAYTGALPSFRNLGILLRILIIANVLAFAVAVAKSSDLGTLWRQTIEISSLVEPMLILSLLALAALNDVLRRAPYWLGAFAVLALELALTTALYFSGRALLWAEPAPLVRYWLLVALATAALLVYFDLRGRALSPALTEARLQALQARIRPHFLFNSLNAVLSLIRQDPRRAETALEDMADLFRTLMADNRELAPLAREVELCRQYLDLEQLRLGERLKVEWRTDRMPRDAVVPPLVLQPLLENAVYHGIEPRVEPGVVSIEIYAAGDEVHAVLRNPYRQGGNHHAGNKMALANIRERLQLHFDAEAALTTKLAGDVFQVHIVVPYVRGRES